MSDASRSRHCLLSRTADIVCCVTQQKMSAVSHSRHCLLCHTANTFSCVTQPAVSAVSHSRHCLLCHRADNVCCVTHQTVSVLSHIMLPLVTWLWSSWTACFHTWLSWVFRMVLDKLGISKICGSPHDSQAIAGDGGATASWVHIVG